LKTAILNLQRRAIASVNPYFERIEQVRIGKVLADLAVRRNSCCINHGVPVTNAWRMRIGGLPTPTRRRRKQIRRNHREKMR